MSSEEQSRDKTSLGDRHRASNVGIAGEIVMQNAAQNAIGRDYNITIYGSDAIEVSQFLVSASLLDEIYKEMGVLRGVANMMRQVREIVDSVRDVMNEILEADAGLDTFPSMRAGRLRNTAWDIRTGYVELSKEDREATDREELIHDLGKLIKVLESRAHGESLGAESARQATENGVLVMRRLETWGRDKYMAALPRFTSCAEAISLALARDARVVPWIGNTGGRRLNGVLGREESDLNRPDSLRRAQ